MEISIEPVLKKEIIKLRETLNLKEISQDLAHAYGVDVQWQFSEKKISSIAELFIEFADELARQRECTGQSLRKNKDLGAYLGGMNFTFFKKSVSILGSGKIIEALAYHFSLLEWTVRSISAEEIKNTDIDAGECILIACENSNDQSFVRFALQQQPAYVGVVTNHRRALEIIAWLKLDSAQLESSPIFIPAGLDIKACNANEIALSVTAEILKEMREVEKN